MNEWNNDINNLFKRAAEEYPLKTGKGEWYKVEKNLRSKQIVIKTENGNNLVKRVGLFALIIFFIISGIIVSYHTGVQQPSSNYKSESKPKSAEPKKQTVLSGKKVSTEKQDQFQLKQNEKNPDIMSKKRNPTIKLQIKPEIVAKVGNYRINANNNSIYLNSSNLSSTTLDQPYTASHYIETTFPTERILNVYKPDKLISNTIIFDQQKTQAFLTLDAFDTNKKNNEYRNEPHKINMHLSSFFQRFYVGVTGSAELSKVKNSGYTNPGNSFSLVTGYQLNGNLSFETGIRRNNLYYKSFGTYYDRSKLNLTTSAEIVRVNGYNRISEIPFLMQYRFTGHSKNRFKLAAGTNLTILHQENYSYLVNRFGKSESIKREYNKTSAKLFSDLIFSAGHESYLGHNTVLSIEPFYRMPIRPTGNGNLSVTSIGANIGLIRYLN